MLLSSLSCSSLGSGYRLCAQVPAWPKPRAGCDCVRFRCAAASFAPTPPLLPLGPSGPPAVAAPFEPLRCSVSVSYDDRTSFSRTTLGVVTAVEHSVRFDPFRPSEPPLRTAAALDLDGMCSVSGLVPFVELVAEPHEDTAEGSSAAPSTEVEGVEAVTFESLGTDADAEIEDEFETPLPWRCRERDSDACRLEDPARGGELAGDEAREADEARELGCRRLNGLALAAKAVAKEPSA